MSTVIKNSCKANRNQKSNEGQSTLLDHIWVVQLLQDGNLSDSRGGYSFFLMLKPDLFDGNHTVSVSPPPSVDHTIGALSNLLKIVELQAERAVMLLLMCRSGLMKGSKE